MIEALPLQLILTGMFGIALVFASVMSVVLFYHWVRYSVGIASTALVMVIYAAGAALLVLAALGVLVQLP